MCRYEFSGFLKRCSCELRIGTPVDSSLVWFERLRTGSIDALWCLLSSGVSMLLFEVAGSKLSDKNILELLLTLRAIKNEVHEQVNFGTVKAF
jgi:hypothetical protein